MPVNELSLDEIKRILLEMKKNGVVNININGGAPLMRPDFHRSLAKYAFLDVFIINVFLSTKFNYSKIVLYCLCKFNRLDT